MLQVRLEASQVSINLVLCIMPKGARDYRLALFYCVANVHAYNGEGVNIINKPCVTHYALALCPCCAYCKYSVALACRHVKKMTGCIMRGR